MLQDAAAMRHEDCDALQVAPADCKELPRFQHDLEDRPLDVDRRHSLSDGHRDAGE